MSVSYNSDHLLGLRQPRAGRKVWQPSYLAAVVLGHGLLLAAWLHLAAPQPRVTGAPVVPALTTTLRLVVNLLPLADPSSTAPASPRKDTAPPSQAPSPVAPATPAQAGTPWAGRATELPVADDGSVPPALQWDNRAVGRALAEAEQGTVRGLAKRAGRLDEVERLRADPLAAGMASAATPTLREAALARITDDAKCKQELGKSGVGERSHTNDRDTFMSSYIGAGKDCKK